MDFSPWDYVDFDNRRMKDVGNWLDDYVQRYLRNNHVLEGTKHVAEKCKGYANAFKKVSKAINFIKKAYDAIHGIIHACDHLGERPEDEGSANSSFFDTEETGAMAQPDGPRHLTINFHNTISPKLIMLLNYANATINMNKLLWGPEADWDEVSWLDQERMIDNIDFLIQCYQALGRTDLLEPIHRAMYLMADLQQPAPLSGWSDQYESTELSPAHARSYEPRAINTGVTMKMIRTMCNYYCLTGDERFLEGVPSAINFIDSLRLSPEDEERWGRPRRRPEDILVPRFLRPEDGAEIKKIIVVPGRIVNIVMG